MRELNLSEIHTISGGNMAGILGATAGTAGALYGGALGASVSFPFGGIGLVFALTTHGGILWEGVALSVGIMAAGPIIGALLGGTLGGGIGASSGYVIDSVRS